MNKKTSYNGNDLFNINFNLYGIEGLRVNTLKNILDGFKFEYYSDTKKALSDIGLELHKFECYSPKFYNFSGDSIDAKISIKDIDLYKKSITANKTALNTELAKNTSYSGYMALTINSVDKELIATDSPDFTADTLIISYLLSLVIDYNDFFIDDYYLYDYRLSMNN